MHQYHLKCSKYKTLKHFYSTSVKVSCYFPTMSSAFLHFLLIFEDSCCGMSAVVYRTNRISRRTEHLQITKTRQPAGGAVHLLVGVSQLFIL